MSIPASEIRRQYKRAKSNGWLDTFEDIAKEHGTSVAHFLALGSRETNLRNIKGDEVHGKAHGYGVLQIDIGTDSEFAQTWSASNAIPGILRGGEIYGEKAVQIEHGQGKTLSVRGKKFVGKPVMFDDIRRLATAAYNSGLWSYYYWSNGQNMDSGTTGKDYSRDVYDRAIEFAKLREEDGETDALKREIELQGKYAREEHRKLVSDVAVKEEPTKQEPSVTPPPVESGPTVNVEHADEVTSNTSTPVPGGAKDDAPMQATQGGRKSTIATIVGSLGGVGTAVLGWLHNNGSLAMVGIICATVVILTWMFRQVIIDYFRMKYMSEPSKLNVK